MSRDLGEARVTNRFIGIGYKFLALPICYDLFQLAVGSVRFRKEIVRTSLSNFERQTVLELGCGTASTVDLLSLEDRYIGLDISPRYLRKARKRFDGKSKKFILSDVSDKSWTNDAQGIGQTLGLALGVFHHLNEKQIQSTFENLGNTLVKTSKIVSIDPIIDSDSSSVARWFALNDRGPFLREPAFYKELFDACGFEMTYRITRNSFRIPYDLLIMTAKKVK